MNPRDQAKAVKLLQTSVQLLKLLQRLVVDGNEAVMIEAHLTAVRTFLALEGR